MASNGLLWTFTQLSGPSPKTLTLGGWSAPFGRPRHEAIFNGGIQVRKQRTDYPGRNLAPTIHTFGTTLKPIDMHGRWMDRQIPQVGGALQYYQNWKSFVADQLVVRMSWGGIISYQIFIDDIDMQFESPQEIVWKLVAECLVDEQQPIPATVDTTTTPFDTANQMLQLMQNLGVPYQLPEFGSLLGMLNEISDQLAILKGQLDAPFAAIYNTCSALTSFESAVTSDLTSMLSGIGAMQTGLLGLRDETDYMTSSAAELNSPNAVALNDINGGLFTSPDVISLVTFKQQNDAAVNGMLMLLQQLESQINQTRRAGTPNSAYVAQAGDTWEIAGDRVLGSADAGRRIRDMNGIKYGQLPQTGVTYSVPK